MYSSKFKGSRGENGIVVRDISLVAHKIERCKYTFLKKNLDIAKKCITFALGFARDLNGGCSSVG